RHGSSVTQVLTESAKLAAARMARGQVVLGAMDDIDFLHPVKVGEIAILRAQVEYIGRSSLGVGVRVGAESVSTGARSGTLNSHLVFVSVGDDIRPRPVRGRSEPRGAAEAALVEAARQRREQRLTRWAKRRDLGAGTRSGESEPLRTSNRPPSAQAEPADPDTTWRFESVRSVLPEDALFGTTMFAGKLLMALDEAGGILSMRYCRGLVMTACLDAMDFYAPVSTYEVVTF